jgi:AraC family transcriptional regulator, regulatory protein of adaptative response / methylated-DNA-[protein]-cysteine methyltransferase
MNEDLFWQASIARDANFNGVFFLCVRTTKIFCKPTCTARQPKRENVEFSKTWHDAEYRGFRACLRCKPKLETSTNPQTETVVKACEIIDSETEISLESLAEKLGISLFHLQRTFKEIVGVSPKKYAENLRISKFKGELKRGTDVVSALYESGYGSSRGLYENVSSKLGMTPSTYQKGGKNMKISYTIADCFLGRMLVAATDKGVCAVTFGDVDSILEEGLSNEFPKAEISSNDAKINEYVEAIIDGLAGRTKIIDLPLDLQATAFQMQVLETLKKIPFGETISYKELAEKIGNPKAVRAVARACATNRIAVVIPCHRVIGSDGSLSGYRWGIERKKQLLEIEKQ